MKGVENMAEFKKGDIVRYGKEKYKIDSEVRQIPYGEHNREKVAIVDENGKRFWVDTKDLKPEGKNLNDLIKDSLDKSEKEMKLDEKEKAALWQRIQTKQKEKEPPAKAVSFTVVTRDYVNGETNGYRPKETVVSGETKNGTKFEASVYGKNISKEALERVADSRAKSMDLTEARLSKSAAQDKINMMLADNSADYVVFYNGVDVTAFEFNDDAAIQEAENLEDFGDLYPEEPETNDRLSLADQAREAGASDEPIQYTSQTYDNEEQEFDDLLDLSGIEDIAER